MSALSDGTEALGAALGEEHALYSSLLDLAGREESALVGGDVEELTELTDEKEQLLELLATMETERTTALTAIAAAAGVPAETLTLTAVAELIDDDGGVALTESGMQLRATALALREANERNAELLRGSHELIDRWIQYLRAIISGSLNYTAEGEPDDGDGGRVIDRSA